MTDTMLMAAIDSIEVEPVLITTEGASARLTLDDGTEITFDRQELTAALVVPRCECGHTEGDHASNRASFPHPLKFGVCRTPGCDCREFVERTSPR
jgi:hypothetical protein